jgi:DNA-directed RNA polymerase specialized sigma24 family protein
VLQGVAALSLLVVGIFFPPTEVVSGGVALIVLGVVVLLAVVGSAISQVEFGIPSVFKVTAAVRDRQEKLRQVFEEQRPDLAACAKLLCDDPATANELLTAAMARATLDWRGPIDRGEIRTYVLCWFVHRLMAHSRLAGMEQPATTAATIQLSDLPTIQRVVVVLTLFAEVPIEELAEMVGLSPAEAQAELSRGETILTDDARRRGV